MPDPTSEVACTAAVDLPDVRCAAGEHPHRGAHHATRNLDDGTRVTVFWWTPDTPDADTSLDRELPHHRVDVPEPAPPRLPSRLRRTDYARLSVAGAQVVIL
jgi:hypothetical protein